MPQWGNQGEEIVVVMKLIEREMIYRHLQSVVEMREIVPDLGR